MATITQTIAFFAKGQVRVPHPEEGGAMEAVGEAELGT